MTENINIVFASDDNYAQHMGIVIISCLENTPRPERLRFYILVNNISLKNREKVTKIIQKYSAYCVFIEPDTHAYRDIPKVRYGVAALFRLSMDTLLPNDVSKVIYLDCDVLLYADIGDLWRIDLEDKIVGAVTNLGHQPLSRLGIEDGEYFNSGVLLIDVDKWRNEDIGNKALGYMNTHVNNLLFPDQDGLNFSLKSKWKHLPLRWNQQPATYSMFIKKKYEKSLSYQDYYDAIANPAIVHFLSSNKPWNYLTYHPLKEAYYYYLKKSPWSDYKPADFTIGNIIKKWFSLEKNLKRLYRRHLTPRKIKTLR